MVNYHAGLILNSNTFINIVTFAVSTAILLNCYIFIFVSHSRPIWVSSHHDIPLGLVYNLSLDFKMEDFLNQTAKLSRLRVKNYSPYALKFPPFCNIKSVHRILPTSKYKSTKSRVTFYSVVPKTGSSTLTFLLTSLSGSKYSRPPNVHFLMDGKRRLPMMEDNATISIGNSMLEDVQKMAKLYQESYAKDTFIINVEHRCFFDASIFNVPKDLMPNWIGTVRDPIERYASNYYYRSKPFAFKPAILHLNYSSFDECSLAMHPDCYYKDGVQDRFQYTFFCGNAPECFYYNHRPSLQLAKFNVEDNYAVVGVLEELSLSLKIFEHNLPQFFANVTHMYALEASKKNQSDLYVNRNLMNQQKVSSKVRQHLLKSPVFQLEYEFYDFVVQKLHMQAMHLKLI